MESGFAAAVLRPLHLRASRRAAEGGVRGLAALGGCCGEKTSSGPGLAHLGLTLGGEGSRDRGAAPSQSFLWSRERKDTGLTETQPAIQRPHQRGRRQGEAPEKNDARTRQLHLEDRSEVKSAFHFRRLKAPGP